MTIYPKCDNLRSWNCTIRLKPNTDQIASLYSGRGTRSGHHDPIERTRNAQLNQIAVGAVDDRPHGARSEELGHVHIQIGGILGQPTPNSRRRHGGPFFRTACRRWSRRRQRSTFRRQRISRRTSGRWKSRIGIGIERIPDAGAGEDRIGDEEIRHPPRSIVDVNATRHEVEPGLEALET